MTETLKLTGLDPSVGRTSQCVLVAADYDPVSQLFVARQPMVGEHEDLPAIVDWVVELEEEEPSAYIGVDISGLGRGVSDFLRKTPFEERVHPFVANSRPSRDWEKPPGMNHSRRGCNCTGCLMESMYVNFKTRIAHQFRQHAYKGKVRVPDHEFLKRDLQNSKLIQQNGKWKLEDPKISPDFSDALLISFAGTEMGENFWMGD